MKKKLSAIVLLSLLFVGVPRVSAAVSIGSGEPLPVAMSKPGTFLPGTLLVLGQLGQLALVYAILSGVDPWTDIFDNVAYDYPNGTNGQ